MRTSAATPVTMSAMRFTERDRTVSVGLPDRPPGGRTEHDLDRALARRERGGLERHDLVRLGERDHLLITVGEPEPVRAELQREPDRELAGVAHAQRDRGGIRQEREDLAGVGHRAGEDVVRHHVDVIDPRLSRGLVAEVHGGLGVEERETEAIGEPRRLDEHRSERQQVASCALDVLHVRGGEALDRGSRDDARRRGRRHLRHQVGRGDRPEERRRGQPSQERAPEARRQPRGEQDADPARLRRHRLFTPDRGELADRRLRRPHRVVEEARLGEQRLRGGIGEHQVDRLAADRERGRGRSRELVRLRGAFDRVGVAQDRRWRRARPAPRPPRRPTRPPGGARRSSPAGRPGPTAPARVRRPAGRRDPWRDRSRGATGSSGRRTAWPRRGPALRRPRVAVRRGWRLRERHRPRPPPRSCRRRVHTRRPSAPAGRGAMAG